VNKLILVTPLFTWKICLSALKRESRHFPSLVFHLWMIQSQLYKNRLRFSSKKEDEKKMRSYSKNLFTVKLPKGFDLQESVSENGKTQTSPSFPFELLFRRDAVKAFSFADRFAEAEDPQLNTFSQLQPLPHS
jgi:hypothetical protein